MKYLVMECHPAYAIVLDENGRFLRVANLGYVVGDRVSDVFGPAESPAQPPKVISIRRWAAPLASMAACLCVMITVWQFALTPYGTVRMEINPDIRLTVNRIDRVTGIEALNEDGESLVENYPFRWKTLTRASGELADMAKEQGFLDADGMIRLTVDSGHENWKRDTEERLLQELKEHVGEQISVILSDMEEENAAEEAALTVKEEKIIVVPVETVEETAEKTAEDGSLEAEVSSAAESRTAEANKGGTNEQNDVEDDRDDGANEPNATGDDRDDDVNEQDDVDDDRDDGVNEQDDVDDERNDDADEQDDVDDERDDDADEQDDVDDERDDDADDQDEADDGRDDDADDQNEDDDSGEEDDD